MGTLDQLDLNTTYLQSAGAEAFLKAWSCACPMLHSVAALQVLSLLDDALKKAQEVLLEQQPDKAVLSVKYAVHARLCGLALHHDSLAREASPAPSDVGAAHTDRLLTLVGTVTKTGPVKALEERRQYECTRCRHKWVFGSS